MPIYELDEAKVKKRYRHVHPFPKSSGDMIFGAWRLAHAVKKAEFVRLPSPQILLAGTVGHILEDFRMFDWKTSELRLNEGMSNLYADFSATGLAGRIAQGVALLFLEEQGYAYVGRFETEWKQRAATQNKSWPVDKKKAPDFIAENENKERVLAESKGGFAHPGIKPNVKGALKEGLCQLYGWDKYITPQPKKSYTIGTFLRESGDRSEETSVIAFVDPEPAPPHDPVEFPTDAVRRANYASWLSLMGFEDAAGRLRTGAGETQRNIVPVLVLDGHEYAVSFVSVAPTFPDLSSPKFRRGFRDGFSVELIGLDLNILRILSSALSSSRISDLMELEPGERRETPIERDGGTFYGSIFSDGSLFGEFRLRGATQPFQDFELIEMDL